MPGKNKEVSMNVFIILSYNGVGNATVFMHSVYRYEWQLYMRAVNIEIKVGDVAYVIDSITPLLN
jgi:hypothetical protein